MFPGAIIGAQPVSSAAILAVLTTNPAVLPDGSEPAPGLGFAAQPATGMWRSGNGTIDFTFNGGNRVRMNAGNILVGSALAYSFSNTVTPGSADLALFRDAADTLAQRRGITGQAFRLYNTYTDASNYERATLGWSGNLFQISADAAGTGAQRNIRLTTQGTNFDIAPSGVTLARDGTSNGTQLTIGGSSLTSTAQLHTRLAPSINQASGAYTVLDINPTETAIGAGPHYFLRARRGAGSDDFNVDRVGNATFVGGNVKIGNSLIDIVERTDPGGGAANTGRLYVRDNGSGKTQLVVVFPTGAPIVLATEP